MTQPAAKYERNFIFFLKALYPKNSRRNLSLRRCLKRQLQPLHKPNLLLLPCISGHISSVLSSQQPPRVLESKLLLPQQPQEPLSANRDFPPLRSKPSPSFFCCYLPHFNFSPRFLTPVLQERLGRLRLVPFNTGLSPVCRSIAPTALSF